MKLIHETAARKSNVLKPTARRLYIHLYEIWKRLEAQDGCWRTRNWNTPRPCECSELWLTALVVDFFDVLRMANTDTIWSVCIQSAWFKPYSWAIGWGCPDWDAQLRAPRHNASSLNGWTGSLWILQTWICESKLGEIIRNARFL